MRLNIKRFAIEASNDTNLTSPASSTYKYTLSVSFTENDTSTTNNTSSITCSASLAGKNISYSVSGGGTLAVYWHDNKNNSDILVASETIASVGMSYGTKTVSGTYTATHKDDGSLSGYAKAVFTKNKSNSYIPSTGDVSTSNTALTNIPRASSIYATTANIGSNSTITINRAVSSFTHTVTYSFNNGAVSGTVATKTTSTSLSLTLPTSLYAQIPNASEINGTLTCITYSGNTEIGRSTGSIKATVPSTAKPTVSVPTLTDTDTVSKDTIKVYVQGKSKLQFNFTNCFSSSYSATLKLYTLKINGTQVYSDSQSTYTMTTPLPNTTNTYELIVTDSRGLTATTGEKNITAYAYSAPTCSISAERNSSTPTTVVIKYSGAITNINNNNKNAKSFKIEFKQSTASSWTTVTTVTDGYTKTNVTVNKTGVSDSNSFDFRIIATDSYNVPATATVSIGTSATLINFNANGNTLALGKASEKSDTFEVNIKSEFQKDVNFTGAVTKNGSDILQPAYNRIGTLSNLNTKTKTNLVSAINEVNTKNIITVSTPASNVTGLSISSAWTLYNINMTQTTSSNGTLLTLNGGGVRIGTGVTKVLVSGTMLIRGRSGSDTLLMGLRKNTSDIKQAYSPSNIYSIYTWVTITIPPCLVSVSSGDTIYLTYAASTTGNVDIGGAAYTYLTVEAIA